MIHVLGRQDVEKLLQMKDAIASVETVLMEMAVGHVHLPLRPILRIPKHRGSLAVMPAYIEGMEALGVKLVTTFPDNPISFNLPTIQGIVVLINPENGNIISIMDAVYITAIRTAAASAVATKYLAKEDAENLGIFGAGIQGWAHLLAVSEVRNIKSVKVYDIRPGLNKRFSDEMSRELGIDVISAAHPEEVVEGSDIIVTATTSNQPVFKGEWLDEGTHINAIGSHGPEEREIDDTTVSRAEIVAVDSREAVLKEGGGTADITIPLSKGLVSETQLVELGQIVSGQRNGRANDKAITLFKSVGLAIEDVSVGLKVYRKAKEAGKGRQLSFE